MNHQTPIILAQPKTLPATKISESGINFLKQFEGFYDKPYFFCSSNQHRIVYALENRELLQHFDIDQSDKLLRTDIKAFENLLGKHNLNLNQHQFNALDCLVFNVEQAQFEKSQTSKNLKSGHYVQAFEWAGFKEERKAGKKGELITSACLKNRWVVEIALFNKEILEAGSQAVLKCH